MSKEILIIGAGSWGNALAHLLSRKSHKVTICTSQPRLAEALKAMQSSGKVDRKYAAVKLPAEVTVIQTKDLEAIDNFSLVVMACDAAGYDSHRVAIQLLARSVSAPVLIATKAVTRRGLLMPEYFRSMVEISDELIGVISGPNLARRIAENHFAGSVIAFKDPERQDDVARIFESTFFRIDRSGDRDGIALVGAGKNAIAVLVGIVEGLGYDKNGVGYVLGKSFAELWQIGERMGADFASFTGIAGIGDMWTSSNPESRNYSAGFELARGPSSRVRKYTHHTVEGIENAHGLVSFADKQGITPDEIPMLSLLSRVLLDPSDTRHVSIQQAETVLLARAPRVARR